MNKKTLELSYCDLFEWNFKYYNDLKTCNIHIELPFNYVNKLDFRSGLTQIVIDDMIDINLNILNICVTNEQDRINIDITAGEVEILDMSLTKATLYGLYNDWIIPISTTLAGKFVSLIKTTFHMNKHIKIFSINKLSECKFTPIIIGDSVDILLSDLQSEQDIVKLRNELLTNSNNEYFLIVDIKNGSDYSDVLNLVPHKRKFNIVFYRSIHDKVNKLVLGIGELKYINEDVFRIKP